jgi:hypothetical protein
MDNIIKFFVFATMTTGAYLAGKDSQPRGIVIPLVNEVEIESAEK